MSVLPRLHVITNDEVLASPSFVERADAVVKALGSRGALHLRGHGTSARRLFEIARTLAGAVLIINDRLDIAMAVRATGLQVGSRSFRVDEVRRLAPKLSVGVSVHTVDEAASTSGADWIIAGHIFDTPSHAGEPSRGLDFLHQICRVSSAPVIAIGGIQPRDVKAIRGAGAYGVAVVRGVWDMAGEAVRQAIDAYLGELDR